MFDEEERLVYESRMLSLADVESKTASAEEKGMEKAAQVIALNMIKMKTEISVITAATGLSQSIIEQLKNKIMRDKVEDMLSIEADDSIGSLGKWSAIW